MEIQKQKFFYNNLIPLQSVKEGTDMRVGPGIVHYAALDISSDEYGLNDKQYIFCAITDNYNIEIVEKKDAYMHIHTRFIAFWANSDFDVIKKSLELLLNQREYHLLTRIDSKTGKLMVKLAYTANFYSNGVELPAYNEEDVKEILQWIKHRKHSDDIE